MVKCSLRHFLGRIICGGLSFLFAVTLNGMPPPTPQQVKQYKADGTWAERVARAKELGNQKVDPGLVARTRAKLQREVAQATGLPLPPNNS